MPTYPSNPDYWTEITTTPSGGHWVPYDYTVIEIDFIHKIVGAASIYVKTSAPYFGYDYSGVRFSIDDGLEFDGTQPNCKLNFMLDLRTSVPGLTGNVDVFLYDFLNNIRQKSFSQAVDNNFVQVTLDVGADHNWTNVTANFDWTKIKHVVVQCELYRPLQPFALFGEWNIDELHFSYDLSPTSKLTLSSTPAGKVGTYTDYTGSYPFTTPSEVVRNVGTTATVQIDKDNFEYWDDDHQKTNPTRDFTFLVIDSELTAVYTPILNPLLTISSFDQNMKSVSGTSAVKLVYSGIPQFVNVPFAARVNKGLFSFTAQDTAKRVFDHWILPNQTRSTDRTITWDIQTDTRVEVHWQVTGENGGNNMILIIGAILAVGGFVFLMTRRKK